MNNREKNITRLAVVAVILALNLLGLSVAYNFLTQDDDVTTVIVERDGQPQIQFVHIYEDNDNYSDGFLCDEEYICDWDCPYCGEVIINLISLHFTVNRRGIRWRSFGGFHGFSAHGGGNIYPQGGIYGGTTGIGFLSGDGGGMGLPFGNGFAGGGFGEGSVEDIIGADTSQPMDILAFESNIIYNDSPIDDGLPDDDEPEPPDDEDMPSSELAMADISDDEFEARPTATSADPTNDSEDLEQPQQDSQAQPTEPPEPQAQPQPNPQTSDDFSLMGLVVSAVGLLLSVLILAITTINKRAAKINHTP